jgi:hypothetical protein
MYPSGPSKRNRKEGRKRLTTFRRLYWSRDFSSSLGEGVPYTKLPRAVIISILASKQFDCAEFYSEYIVSEKMRHTPLSDKFLMPYFELPKLPEALSADDVSQLWLKLLKAETEEELEKIKKIGSADYGTGYRCIPPNNCCGRVSDTGAYTVRCAAQ